MNNYKIHVPNEAESKEAQELFFELGYDWFLGTRQFSNCSSKLITAHSDGLLAGIEHDGCEYKELTLPKLRDLVVLHRSDENDANYSLYISTSQPILNLYKTSEDVFFVFDTNPECWVKSRSVDLKTRGLKLIEKPQSAMVTEMSEVIEGLISGADAKLAWAKGEDVQILCAFDEFCLITTNLSLSIFDDPKNKFRLKPRTIKLEIEVPAPFEPKMGDKYFFLSSNGYGYDGTTFSNDDLDKEHLIFGAWRTKEEVKQVAEQLRKIKELSK